MNNDIISTSAAIEAAVKYAGFTAEEIHGLKTGYADGLFEISFQSDWSIYICYVDAASCEVLGFGSEPFVDSDYVFDQCGCAGGLKFGLNIVASKK